MSLLRDFDTGFLATHTMHGGIRGRPMALAEIEGNGDIYFAAGLDSPKVAEIKTDPRVASFFQGKTKWISLTGRARIVTDRALISRLWKESWKLWFPNGKDDPNICLIAFDPSEAEYWDNGGAQGVRFVLEAAKAALSGTKMDSAGEGQHAKVKM